MENTNTKYTLDLNLLKVGDVILTADKTFSSYMVRLGTLGRFSHASIYLGRTVIEATPDGVFSVNPQRILRADNNHIAVYRHKTGLSKEQVRKLIEYAHSKVGSLYAFSETVLMQVRSKLGTGETKKLFCSRLVAKAYQYAGVDLGNLRDPSYCTPQQLKLCNVFTKVPNAVKGANEQEFNLPNLMIQLKFTSLIHLIGYLKLENLLRESRS